MQRELLHLIRLVSSRIRDVLRNLTSETASKAEENEAETAEKSGIATERGIMKRLQRQSARVSRGNVGQGGARTGVDGATSRCQLQTLSHTRARREFAIVFYAYV